MGRGQFQLPSQRLLCAYWRCPSEIECDSSSSNRDARVKLKELIKAVLKICSKDKYISYSQREWAVKNQQKVRVCTHTHTHMHGS